MRKPDRVAARFASAVSRAAAAAVIAIFAVYLCFPACVKAESTKIGVQKLAGNGPLYLARENGYFTAEGIDAEFVFFTAAEPIQSALVAGDIDFGGTGLTAATYNLAGQGAVRIIAPNIRDAPGFQLFATIVSNAADSKGLKSYKDLPGHSFAANTIGSSPVYALTLIAAKYGFDPKSIRFMALQSSANVMAAISGGQADASIIVATIATPAIQHGDAKLIGYTGDEVAWQAGATTVATRTANERRDLVERYLRAVAKGRRDYVAAFIGPDGKPKDGTTTQAVVATIAKYVGQPVEQVKLSISYVDPNGRLDVKDVLRQIDWYKTQGMVKPEVNGEQVIDNRYILPLE